MITIFCVALGAMLWAISVPAHAQQPTKIPRIGFLTGISAAGSAARVEAFRQGLRELGYVEGRTLSLSIDTQTEN